MIFRKKWIERKRLIDQPLYVQFMVAGGIVAVFAVLSLSLLGYQVKRQADASRWVSVTHQTMNRLHTLGRDFYRAETVLIEYVK